MSQALEAAMALHRRGMLTQAEAAYRAILAVAPGQADAQHLLALALHQQGRNAEAVTAAERALAQSPMHAPYHNAHGLALRGCGEPDRALTAFRNARALAPDDPETLNNLGLLYSDLHLFGDAEEAFRQALAVRPGYAPAMSNLARVLLRVGDEGEALDRAGAAVAAEPAHAGFRTVYGIALQQHARFAEALAQFRRAVALAPADADAHVNLAHALLLRSGGTGDAEAWAAYEWRLRRRRVAPVLGCPAWDGGPVAGRTILLWTEQGYGDAIQFVRYAAAVADRGARVVVLCRASLRRLFEIAPGVSKVVLPQAPGRADLHAPLMSVPFLTGAARQGGCGPYLRPVARARVPGGAAMRVGLVWAGNPEHANDRHRSIDPQALAPLLAGNKGVQFISLQTGPAAGEPLPGPTPIVRIGGDLGDFADTAGVLDALDLLITVDTSAAHLAGALGKPVWTLLPFVPDWRWGSSGERTRWYPSMRLYRQGPERDWRPVIARVARDLADLARARAGSLA